MNNILRSDYNEYIQNRNMAKLQFLQHEITQFYNLNKQLKDVLNLKRKSLEIMNSKSERSEKNIQMDKIELPQKYENADKDEVLKQLFEENKQLLSSFKIVSQERNNAQSKALINQQVAEEVENFQQDILQEQEDSLLELRRIVQDKEYTVQEFEKQKSQVTIGGVIVKYRDIVTPTEQQSKLQSLNESYNTAVQILKKQNEYLTDMNKKYELENEFASFELIKLKSAMANTVNMSALKSSAQEQAHKDQQQNEILFSKYLKDQDIQRIKSNMRNKKKIEEDWDRVKKNFDRELINERILSDQMTQLESYNQQLLLTNDQILSSNQLHQSQIEKLQQNINFYKEYHKKIVKLQNKMKQNKLTIQPQNTLITSSNSFNDISISKIVKSGPQSTKSRGSQQIKPIQLSQQVLESKRKYDQQQDNSKIRTKTKLETILNNSVDHINIPTLNDEEDTEPEWNVRECKQFLKNLADDFYSSNNNCQQMILSRKIITKIQQDGGIGFQMQQKRYNKVRSISNILEYKRDKRNDEFYLQNKRDFSQQFNKRPFTNYVNTENDEYIDAKDVILEGIKQKNNLNNNNNNNNKNESQSNNNSSSTHTHQNGTKNLEQFGVNSINIQNSQFISNPNLPNIGISHYQTEMRTFGGNEGNQPGDISTFLDNGVDVSYELRSKQIGSGNHGSGQNTNGNNNNNNLHHNINGQITHQNQQSGGANQKQDMKSSVANKKGTFISTHSPSYVPNQKKAIGTTQPKNKQNQYNNDEQSFISNDDYLNNQILSSQIDIRLNTNTQYDEK